MKLCCTISLIVLAFCLSLSGHAQTISQVTILPAAPTPNDSISIIVQSTFSTYAYTVVNPVNSDTANYSITIQLFKCKSQTGAATTITDTFQLGQLPEGTYTVNILLFVANQQGASGNCGAFTMADTDNSSLLIGTPTTVTGITPDKNILYPNPASSELFIRSSEPGLLIIYDMRGQAVKKIATGNSIETIDISELPAGIYTGISITSSGNTRSSKLVIAR